MIYELALHSRAGHNDWFRQRRRILVDAVDLGLYRVLDNADPEG